MESFFIMLRLQLMLLIFLAAGVYIRKRNIVPKEAQPYFTEFLVRIALPCMIFNSFRPGSASDILLPAVQALLISSVVSLFSFIIGAVLYRGSPPACRAVMRYGTLVSNAGFAGLQQVQGAFGAAGLMYASIYLIPLRILMWSAGISLFTKSSNKSGIKTVLLNPGILAVYAGLFRMLLQIPLPDAVDSAIKEIGDCTNPLSMIAIGMIVADIPLRSVITSVITREACLLTCVRLIVLPVMVLAVLTAIQVDATIKGIAVILTAMPVGVNTPILAQRYGSDHEFASKCVLLSTVLSLFTLPVISIFLF